MGRLIATVFATVAAVAIKRRLDWHNLDLLAQIYEAEFAGHKYGQELEDPKTHHRFMIKSVYPPTLGDLGTWFMSDVIPAASKQVKQDQSQTFFAATLTVLASEGHKPK